LLRLPLFSDHARRPAGRAVSTVIGNLNSTGAVRDS